MTVIHMYGHATDPFTYLMPSVELTGSPLDTDVTAEQYLRYAADALQDGSDRGAMDAFGHAKRALHLIVDSLLHAYGLLAQNRRASFPAKLEMIDAAGLFSLSILNNLNLERNVMEHEYRVPDPARAREMTDVGRLLLLATRRIGEYVPYECSAGWRATQTLGVVQLDPAHGLLSFFSVAGPTQVYDHEGTGVAMLNPIRSRDGGLLPGVEVDPRPVWTVSLRHKNREEWRPLLTPVVRLSGDRSDAGSAVIYDDHIQISMRITLPRHEQGEARDFMRGTGKPVLNYSAFAFGFNPD
jgi:hypothetical protein